MRHCLKTSTPEQLQWLKHGISSNNHHQNPPPCFTCSPGVRNEEMKPWGKAWFEHPEHPQLTSPALALFSCPQVSPALGAPGWAWSSPSKGQKTLTHCCMSLCTDWQKVLLALIPTPGHLLGCTHLQCKPSVINILCSDFSTLPLADLISTQ